ncbi:hypothetical protein MTR_5g038850 [Medicago truncatula]|uniref:YqgF/RNase H-like domain-containing protein n=1 Tax=Medicago truncatula TaxID=3880 RepID=A0A072UEF6_MEDTR|nr:hypothetical protein MTR_5g038850 [Medicago truncatula]
MGYSWTPDWTAQLGILLSLHQLFLSVRSRDYTAMKYMLPKQLYQCVCKALPGRVMGINVGTEYLGVAMSDLENKGLEDSRTSLLRLNDKSGKPKSDAVLASELKDLIDRNNVKGMVIGKLDLDELDSRLPSSDQRSLSKSLTKQICLVI